MTTYADIFEQPEVMENMLSTQKTVVERIAKKIQQKNIEYVFLVARGTSDNAGRYANYLLGAHNRLPLALATPSLFTIYEEPPNLQNALVIAISQSGQSPDINSVFSEGKKQGCFTLAITNHPESPLGKTADDCITISAGVEMVGATKTYTGELLAIAMLSAALNGSAKHWNELAMLPHWAAEALKRDSAIAQSSLRYRYMQRCVVLGRGYNYCTAFEWSLKMKELAYISGEAYSTADFLHGPVSLVEPGFPVMAVAPSGKVFDSMSMALKQMVQQHKIELAVISDDEKLLSLAHVPMPLPKGIPEWLSPIIAIIPGQLFAYHLTRHRGLNVDTPRTITKVTETS